MKRGPRPNPSLRLVKGGAAPRPTKRPAQNDGAPRPLAFLDLVAKREWRRLAPLLHRAGLLTQLDLGPFAAYCSAFSQWRQAELVIKKMAELDPVTGGLMIKTTNGNAVQNPVVGTANKARSDMIRFASEFHLSPDSRGRMIIDVGFQNDPAAEFFQ